MTTIELFQQVIVACESGNLDAVFAALGELRQNNLVWEIGNIYRTGAVYCEFYANTGEFLYWHAGKGYGTTLVSAIRHAAINALRSGVRGARQ